jgi:hypothetical protein
MSSTQLSWLVLERDAILKAIVASVLAMHQNNH